MALSQQNLEVGTGLYYVDGFVDVCSPNFRAFGGKRGGMSRIVHPSISLDLNCSIVRQRERDRPCFLGAHLVSCLQLTLRRVRSNVASLVSALRCPDGSHFVNSLGSKYFNAFGRKAQMGGMLHQVRWVAESCARS